MAYGEDGVVRGSEWRKWDLHVHVPGTKLEDGYTRTESGDLDLDRFCRSLEDSDVAGFGLTDYFATDTFFKIRDRYSSLFPNSTKLLMLNLELRLNETVNNQKELVDYHLIFDPDLDRSKVDNFLYELKTETTLPDGLPLRCSDVKGAQFESVTVSRQSITEAIRVVFGAVDERKRKVVRIVPVNGNGIRTHGATRKAQLSDEIDKASDGFFGNLGSVEHFLTEGRFEDTQAISLPKPVFAGSDSHSFENLDSWLGREVRGSNEKNVTWVKSDLTWDGFLQAFFEPSERVRMQVDTPDRKDSFRWISHVEFPSGSSFPPSVHFNPNLNSIIGSRSSGKSALLAHVAHAVAPEYVEERQASAPGTAAIGPAAGITWSDAVGDTPIVHWAGGDSASGKVIYVPQNSLWAMSERPDEIAAQILPALELHVPAAAEELARLSKRRANAAEKLEAAVKSWWELADRSNSNQSLAANLGDEASLRVELGVVDAEIAERGGGEFDADLLIAAVDAEKRLAELRAQQASSDQFEAAATEVLSAPDLPSSFDLSVDFSRIGSGDMRALDRLVVDWLPEARTLLASALRGFIVERQSREALERDSVEEEVSKVLAGAEKAFAEKAKAEALSPLLRRRATYLSKLDELQGLQQKAIGIDAALEEVVAGIVSEWEAYEADVQDVTDWFNINRPVVEGIEISVEADFDEDGLTSLASVFNKVSETQWVDRALQRVRVDSIRLSPGSFLEDMYAGRQRLTVGTDPRLAAIAALQLLPSTRVTAALDGDTIGGFHPSTMTPGKQALFALQLMLSATDDLWPLLLDQPEDDLDSRAIFETIVTDLKARKRQRQIVVVTHDANVVVGADSEAVIVANRHGEDRPNEDGRLFNYRTGSLEHSEELDGVLDTLRSKGTLEHACSILDGGTTAFRKRWLRYRS